MIRRASLSGCAGTDLAEWNQKISRFSVTYSSPDASHLTDVYPGNLMKQLQLVATGQIN